MANNCMKKWERSAPSICFSFGNNTSAMVFIIFDILNYNFLKVLPCLHTMFNCEDKRWVGRYHDIYVVHWETFCRDGIQCLNLCVGWGRVCQTDVTHVNRTQNLRVKFCWQRVRLSGQWTINYNWWEDRRGEERRHWPRVWWGRTGSRVNSLSDSGSLAVPVRQIKLIQTATSPHLSSLEINISGVCRCCCLVSK